MPIHFINIYDGCHLLEYGAFYAAPQRIRENYVDYALIGWPSTRRKEESHRHVQRVFATLGAKPAKPRYTFNEVPIRSANSLINPFYNFI